MKQQFHINFFANGPNIFKNDKYLCMDVRMYACAFNCAKHGIKISLLKGRSLITGV